VDIQSSFLVGLYHIHPERARNRDICWKKSFCGIQRHAATVALPFSTQSGLEYVSHEVTRLRMSVDGTPEVDRREFGCTLDR
jgi:hypothetical protein